MTIAQQDAALPVCPKGKCSVCVGSKLQHHWMLDFYENEENENDPLNGEMRLICRHCVHGVWIIRLMSRFYGIPDAMIAARKKGRE